MVNFSQFLDSGLCNVNRKTMIINWDW